MGLLIFRLVLDGHHEDIAESALPQQTLDLEIVTCHFLWLQL